MALVATRSRFYHPYDMTTTAHRVDTILHHLRQREMAMAALLSELVSIATENPPGKNYRACVDLLEHRIREIGLPCERSVSTPGTDSTEPVESLLATCGSGPRALYFHGHYDVVPAQSAEQFQPTRKEYSLFGRGSCDMKGGIVAMLYAISALQEIGAPVNGRIVLTLVPDEETGGARGSQSLAQQGLLGRDAIGMLLPEPTSGVIWNACRGALSLRIRVFGKSAHVGLQHQGHNAFERMFTVVQKLQQLKHEVEQRTTQFRLGSTHARNSVLMLGGQSGGGYNFNVVPAEGWFTIDRRINPEENLASEKARILAVLDSCRNDGIPLQWDIFQEAPSASCSAATPPAQSLSRNIQLVTGEAPAFEMCPGLLEIRFYAAQNIPAYAYGPGLLSVAHGPHEYVDLRKVIDTAAIYALTALDLLAA
jgi:succinyl-diaminopimelate desuccinylase